MRSNISYEAWVNATVKYTANQYNEALSIALTQVRFIWYTLLQVAVYLWRQ
jgi:hypothetical protein